MEKMYRRSGHRRKGDEKSKTNWQAFALRESNFTQLNREFVTNKKRAKTFYNYIFFSKRTFFCSPLIYFLEENTGLWFITCYVLKVCLRHTTARKVRRNLNYFFEKVRFSLGRPSQLQNDNNNQF